MSGESRSCTSSVPLLGILREDVRSETRPVFFFVCAYLGAKHGAEKPKRAEADHLVHREARLQLVLLSASLALFILPFCPSLAAGDRGSS